MIIYKTKKTALSILTNNKRFYTVLFFIITVQISSLSIFMPPWFDEVVFADISESVATSNNFLLNIHPLSTNNNEVFFFGPLFFYMQAFITTHLAFSAFFFRLPVYICGVLAAMVLRRILFYITNNKIFERVFLLLFFTNYLICGSLSCGRMEMVALLFISLSLLFLLKNYIKKNYQRILVDGILSGAIFCLAILTTPRSSFLYLLFVVPLFKIFLKGMQTNNFKLISIPVIHIFLSFGLPYFIWYHPHLGDPFEIFNYITPAAKTQISFNNNHIDINSFVWVLIDAGLLIFAILKKVKLPDYVYGFLFSSIIFISAVIPWSYHHGIIIPVLIFTALLILFFLRHAILSPFVSNLLLMIFSIQLFFIAIKYTVIWMDLPSRNSKALQKIIQEYIPEKSRVMGSYNYYYACINNKCEFRSIEDNTNIATGKPVPIIKKIDYLMNNYKAEYIVVYNSEKDELKPFLEINKFTKIASIAIPEAKETFWEKGRRILGLPGYTFYNGSIYKRINSN